jgi:hypothetical protein
MPNPSYCRFRNTLADLRDCRAHIHDPLIAGAIVSEHSARKDLVLTCAEILEACGVSINPPDIRIVENEPQEPKQELDKHPSSAHCSLLDAC